MDPEVRDRLKRAYERLDSLDAYDWGCVETWAASVRPLLVAELPVHVLGFDEVMVKPHWVMSPTFSSTDRYGRQRDNFEEAAHTDEAANTRIASNAKQKILAFMEALLSLPLVSASRRNEGGHPGGIVVHNYGEANMGDKYTTNITDSTIGASAVGHGAKAVGTAQVAISQQEYDAHVKRAQKALVDDQDRLEELSAGLYEALGQFLRVARQIQVDQKSIVEAHAKMKETLDEVWAEQVAKKLRGHTLPATLEVAKTLLESPLTAELARAWFSGG